MPLSENDIVSVNKFLGNNDLVTRFVALFNYQETLDVGRSGVPLQLVQKGVCESAQHDSNKHSSAECLLGCRPRGGHIMWYVSPSIQGYIVRLRGLRQYVLLQTENIETWKVLLQANNSALKMSQQGIFKKKKTKRLHETFETAQKTYKAQKTYDVSVYKVAQNCNMTASQLATFASEKENKIRRIACNPGEYASKDLKMAMLLLGISSAVLSDKTDGKK